MGKIFKKLIVFCCIAGLVSADPAVYAAGAAYDLVVDSAGSLEIAAASSQPGLAGRVVKLMGSSIDDISSLAIAAARNLRGRQPDRVAAPAIK